jgi:hypothetical protein
LGRAMVTLVPRRSPEKLAAALGGTLHGLPAGKQRAKTASKTGKDRDKIRRARSGPRSGPSVESRTPLPRLRCGARCRTSRRVQMGKAGGPPPWSRRNGRRGRNSSTIQAIRFMFSQLTIARQSMALLGEERNAHSCQLRSRKLGAPPNDHPETLAFQILRE